MRGAAILTTVSHQQLKRTKVENVIAVEIIRLNKNLKDFLLPPRGCIAPLEVPSVNGVSQ